MNGKTIFKINFLDTKSLIFTNSFFKFSQTVQVFTKYALVMPTSNNGFNVITLKNLRSGTFKLICQFFLSLYNLLIFHMLFHFNSLHGIRYWLRLHVYKPNGLNTWTSDSCCSWLGRFSRWFILRLWYMQVSDNKVLFIKIQGNFFCLHNFLSSKLLLKLKLLLELAFFIFFSYFLYSLKCMPGQVQGDHK